MGTLIVAVIIAALLGVGTISILNDHRLWCTPTKKTPKHTVQ